MSDRFYTATEGFCRGTKEQSAPSPLIANRLRLHYFSIDVQAVSNARCTRQWLPGAKHTFTGAFLFFCVP